MERGKEGSGEERGGEVRRKRGGEVEWSRGGEKGRKRSREDGGKERKDLSYNLSISLANVPTQTALQSNIPQLELSTHGWFPATTALHFILISSNLVFSP